MPLREVRRVFANRKSGNPLVLFPIVVLRLGNRTASHVPYLELRVLQQQRPYVHRRNLEFPSKMADPDNFAVHIRGIANCLVLFANCAQMVSHVLQVARSYPRSGL